MHRGYTKRWRKRWDKGYHKDLLLWVMMDWFIDHANYKEKEFPFVWKGAVVEMVKIKRGECFFTFEGLANRLKGPNNAVSRKMVRSRVQILEKIGFLGHKSGRKYQVVSILNYDLYNPPKETEGRQSGRHRDIKGTLKGHQWDITNKDKRKIKKDNKEKVTPTFFEKELTQKIEFLKCYGIFSDADLFVNFQKNHNRDEKLICHAFNQLFKKSENGAGGLFRQWEGKQAWAYCEKIILAEGAIKNARQSERESDKHKKELREI